MASIKFISNIHAKCNPGVWSDRLAVGARRIFALRFQSSSSGVRQLAVGQSEASFCSPEKKIMPDFNELYRKHNEQMEDFWSRRANAPKYERTIRIFGHLDIFCSKHETVVDSTNFSEP